MRLGCEEEGFSVGDLFADVVFVQLDGFEVKVVEHWAEETKEDFRWHWGDEDGEEHWEGVGQVGMGGRELEEEADHCGEEINRDDEVGDAEDGRG
mmetsp:Transcript_11439/g.24136  ORF Transcript_11439/g.24136 Transcript_11439/m.24136 type:complete len:95 (-) Transcript_11439:221-505(-)